MREDWPLAGVLFFKTGVFILGIIGEMVNGDKWEGPMGWWQHGWVGKYYCTFPNDVWGKTMHTNLCIWLLSDLRENLPIQLNNSKFQPQNTFKPSWHRSWWKNSWSKDRCRPPWRNDMIFKGKQDDNVAPVISGAMTELPGAEVWLFAWKATWGMVHKGEI
jgi:hypothetical protein